MKSSILNISKKLNIYIHDSEIYKEFILQINLKKQKNIIFYFIYHLYY